MPENAKKPQIRFKGFTDAWEQRKLGNFGKTYTGLSGKTKDDFGHGKAQFITYMNVYSNTIIDVEMTEPIEIDLKQNEVEIGDVFFTTSSETPEEVGMSSVLLKKCGTVYLNSFCFGFRPFIILDNYFLAYMLRAQVTRKQIILLAQGISRYNISKNKVMEINIFVPHDKEQQQLGKFFYKLDNLITLHQRKYFCSNNLIFTITTAWEQRKVTELGKIYIGLVTTMTKHYTSKGTLLIRNSDIKDGRFEFGEEPIYLDEYFAKENLLRMHKIGDVITVHTGDVGTSAVIGEKEENSIGFATIVTRPNSQIIDSNYLSTFLNTDKHKKWAVAISTGDGRTNYNLGDYYKLTIPLPILQEQKAIATFITKINNLITLHQRECFFIKKEVQNVKFN